VVALDLDGKDNSGSWKGCVVILLSHTHFCFISPVRQPLFLLKKMTKIVTHSNLDKSL